MRIFGPVKGGLVSIRYLCRLSIAFGAALLLATAGFAQGVRGTITGQVKDSSGAVIPGATVKLINVATRQVARTAQANADGVYELVEVEPATYNVDIAAPGFSEVVLQNAVVEPNRHLTLDATMKAAGATEEVTVSAGQQLLDRDSATLGTTVDNKRVEDLPLDGREILNLALLQPGVSPVSDNNGGSVDAGNGFRVNGARGNQNNFTLEGANNNEEAVGSDLGNEPRPDAVQEFRLLTGNYEAEFGRNVGSVVNVVIKGGTDKYHGDARIFYRPTFLSSAQFFDNLNGLPKRRFERKEFGGNFGGPLPIPFLDKGKQKTFFFFDYEGRRQLLGNTNQLTEVPTQAMVGGDFSALLQPNNEFSASPIQLVNPFTGKPFPNNIIPSGMISPIAKFYYSFLPPAPASGRVGAQANQITNNNYITARLDHTISDKQQAGFIANYFSQNQTAPFAFGGANTPGFGEVDARNTYNFIFEHTYTIT
ncbi:MAG: carboxypeptidase regulatory-like domain-containing protein, partial [Blastocatellia bacterium]